MKNKAGSISVLVMVILTLLLFISVLVGVVVYSSKNVEGFGDVSGLNKVYSEKRNIEATLYFKLVESFLDGYSKTLSEGSLTVGVVDLNPIFAKTVEERFRSSEPGVDSNLAEIFRSIDYFSFDGKNVYVGRPYFVAERKLSLNSEVKYSSSANASVGFSTFGLPSFEEIKTVLEECNKLSSESSIGGDEFISSCIGGRLSVFNSLVVCELIGFAGVSYSNTLRVVDVPNPSFYEKNNCYIELTSKDKFYINKKLDTIKFRLLLSSKSVVSS